MGKPKLCTHSSCTRSVRRLPMEEVKDAELQLETQRHDLHSLRASDPDLDSRAAQIQSRAAADAVCSLQKDDAVHAAILQGRQVLVTGSAGYLGATLVMALKALGCRVVGLDVVPYNTVDLIGSVADSSLVDTAVKGCSAIMHTAALHAPHATHWPESEYVATNICGTRNVLDAAMRTGNIPVVHTSSTSLTISQSVKAREQRGDLVWLDESAQPALTSAATAQEDLPRNKYGRTKLEAERLCKAAALDGLPVVVMRLPRFFPEEALDKSEGLSGPNVKANELLGRRAALVDIVEAELRALCQLAKNDKASTTNLVGCTLTIVAPWPRHREQTPADAFSAAKLLRQKRPDASVVHQELGWTLPASITRVYDCSTACEVLNWKPRLTFDTLIAALCERTLEASDVTRLDAIAGNY